MEFRNRYKKIIDLIVLFLIISAITLIIKYYFKPFISMIIMFVVASPLYSALLRFNIPKKIAGASSILILNITIIIIVIYLGNSIYDLLSKIYESNVKIIEDLIEWISSILNRGIEETSLGSGALNLLNQEFVRRGALTTGESIAAYFIGNISAFFILIDREKFIDLIKRLIPQDIIKKLLRQKRNFKQMLIIQVSLVFLSTFEIIIGFIILRVPKPVLLGLICGVLDILPYVGTIIVFIPIIIYNIIVKDYLIAIGLICLYILVQVIREILEAKFLSDKLELHPLMALLSIYVGVKIFGIFGIVVGPMYGMLAKEIIYSGFN